MAKMLRVLHAVFHVCFLHFFTRHLLATNGLPAFAPFAAHTAQVQNIFDQQVGGISRTTRARLHHREANVHKHAQTTTNLDGCSMLLWLLQQLFQSFQNTQ